MSISPRKKAVTILMDIEKNTAYTNIEMNKLRASGQFDNTDVRFIGELVNGVVKRKITLDYVIGLHSSVKVKKISPFILNVLRIGVYQLLFMDKIPESAAVNECVKIVKKSSVGRLSSFVNAILRAVRPEDIEAIDDSTTEGKSIKYSFPRWIVERWTSDFGNDFATNLMKSLKEKPDVHIRRTVSVTKSEFENNLKHDGVQFSDIMINEFPDYDYSYGIKTHGSLESLGSFVNNLFYIQDPAASLAAYLAEPQPGDCIIDMCAAPGGKTIFMAELMRNQGTLIACDIYEHKLNLIKENCAKFGITAVDARLLDATIYHENLNNSADKILCDVPCTGLGILRKKPDICYSRTLEDIEILSGISRKILDNAAKYLKPGGVLIFSTCTIEKEENECVVERFLSEHKDFTYYPFGVSENKYMTFYPHIHGTDGFFICRLIKAGDKL